MQARVRSREVLVVVALVAALLVAAGSVSAQEAPLCFGEAATIVAVPGVATVGTDGDDVIVGTAGVDEIRGGAGDDLICGLAGADVISGNTGDDQINGGRGADRVFGGSGRDLLVGRSGADALWGNSGGDTIRGNKGRDHIRGGTGGDTIVGGSGDDTIFGNGGRDEIWGGSGNDTIEGGKKADVLRGQSGDDTLLGNSGDNEVHGGTGFDVCRGGARVASAEEYAAETSCNTRLSTQVIFPNNAGGFHQVVLPPDGRPFIAQPTPGSPLREGTSPLRFWRCDDPKCASVTESVSDQPFLGELTSLSLGADALPILGMRGPTPNLRDSTSWLVACEDAGCTAFSRTEFPDEISVSAAAAPNGVTYVTGNPGPRRRLRVYSCADPTCPGGPVASKVDGRPNSFFRVSVGADGLPFLGGNPDETRVAVIKCLDRACDDTKRTIIEDLGDPGDPDIPATFNIQGGVSDVAAGADGPSAVVYRAVPDPASRPVPLIGPTLAVWEDDPGEAIRVVLGSDSNPMAQFVRSADLAVGPDGRPVVAWLRHAEDAAVSELVVARCDDRSCLTGTKAVVARGIPFVNGVAVDVAPNGRPVLVFTAGFDLTLTMIKCRDAACVKGALEVERWDPSG